MIRGQGRNIRFNAETAGNPHQCLTFHPAIIPVIRLTAKILGVISKISILAYDERKRSVSETDRGAIPNPINSPMLQFS